jgi:hypothetical protein
MKHYVSIVPVGQDINHDYTGKFIGTLKFYTDITPEEAKVYFEKIKTALAGIEVGKSWIEPN